MVVVQKNIVMIYKCDKDGTTYAKVVATYPLAAPKTRVWVGRSSTTPRNKYVGNSVLVQNGTRCVFIGHEVYEFSLAADETIRAYYSVVGNSDVPYPVLRTTLNAYFMLDKKYVALDQLEARSRNKAQWENLYGEFYSFTKQQQQQLAHKMKKVKVVCRSPY